MTIDNASRLMECVRGGRRESYFFAALTALAPFSPQKQIAVLGKHTAKTCPSPKPTIGTTKPPAESIYTVSPGSFYLSQT